jgi:membrane-associated protease RseP (regulator of RpoE activity)
VVPVPILDGGEVLLLAIELVNGRPLGRSTRRTAYWIGAAILILWTGCGAAVEMLRVSH